MRRLWNLSPVPPLVLCIGTLVLGVGVGLGVLSVPATYGGMYLLVLLFCGLTFRADLRSSDDA